MELSKELIELVRCPKCRGVLSLNDDRSGFVCSACKLLYAIEDGLPNFLIDEAKHL
jgi:uncharacterized protein